MTVNVTENVPFVMWFNEADPRAMPRLAMCVRSPRADGARELIVYVENDQKSKKYCVFHMDDERQKEFPERRRQSGGWDYCDNDKLLFELRDRHEKLLEEFSSLSELVTSPKGRVRKQEELATV